MNLVAHIAMAAAETEHHGNVQLETFIFGVIAAVIFALFALVTFSYRHVSNRQAATDDASHGADSHGAGHNH
ncbi:hypothetical protein [uncultured Microbacterium sp.]|uniref:hypothetical protein n=1 Tax=uncultured Microbacterium sp. TaxID=191216 RepID=UPI00262AF8A5|nr:hypothetical protein [uncultured Microbacterium sp.]